MPIRLDGGSESTLTSLTGPSVLSDRYETRLHDGIKGVGVQPVLARIVFFCRSLTSRSGSSAKEEAALPTGSTPRIWPLPTGEHGAWIADARTITSFKCDAVFHLATSFYIGPSHGMTSLEWETANVRLPPVDLPRRFVDRVATAELVDHEHALIDHYRHIIRLAEAHGKSASLSPFPYFRTQPEITAEGQVLTEFAWNDDAHETQTFLEGLARADDGPPQLLHDDQDQGWHVLIAATGTVTCLIEWDAEDPIPTSQGYAFEPAELARQAASALERLNVIHQRLIEAFGRDYWT